MSIRLAVLGWVAAWGFCWAAAPSVTNVQAAQRRGTPYVDIGYDLSGSGTDLSVTVAVSTNGGAVYFTPASGLSGDVGRGVAQGSGKKMVWNAGAALSPALYNNVRVKVTAGDAPDGMVLIPAGTNSGTDPDFGAYSLTVSAFYMDATEVTKAQWDAVYTWAVANGYGFDNAGSGKAADHPVLMVSWYDCVKWCNARSEKDGRTPCYTVGGSVYKTGSYGWDGTSVVVCNFFANGYRLPTNTEWEYAARGGLSGRRFPWGDIIDHTRANYCGYPSRFTFDQGYGGWDTRYGEYPHTSPAGAFAANGYGLYDMAGNVWEWCNDTSGSPRGDRGGGWDYGAGYARCGGGFWLIADDAGGAFGFRSVCR